MRNLPPWALKQWCSDYSIWSYCFNSAPIYTESTLCVLCVESTIQFKFLKGVFLLRSWWSSLIRMTERQETDATNRRSVSNKGHLQHHTPQFARSSTRSSVTHKGNLPRPGARNPTISFFHCPLKSERNYARPPRETDISVINLNVNESNQHENELPEFCS